MKEIDRLVGIGVLKRQTSSQWASPTFIIPKKDMTVRTISDFWELNKRIIRRPSSIPKISTTVQELEGFTYATALDLNMGYDTIRLDPRAVKSGAANPSSSMDLMTPHCPAKGWMAFCIYFPRLMLKDFDRFPKLM